MSKDDPYHDQKVQHLAAKINAEGQVSALCFSRPHAIRLAVAGWTGLGRFVTCKKCLAILKGRGVDLATYSAFEPKSAVPDQQNSPR